MCSPNQAFDQFAIFDCLMLEDKRLKLGKSQMCGDFYCFNSSCIKFGKEIAVILSPMGKFSNPE